MPQNTLVINCDIRETRVALIEEGIIAELQIERASARGTVGNIVLGRVTRVLPGMQAAFIDVGMERAAFLHVEDLIRPDDFDAYLAGARRDGEDEHSTKGVGGRRHGNATQSSEDAAAAEAADEDHDDSDDEAVSAEDPEDMADEADADEADEALPGEEPDEADEGEDPEDSGDGEEEEEEEEEDEEDEVDATEEDETHVEGEDPASPSPVVVGTDPAADENVRRRRRRRRRRGGRDDRPPEAGAPAAAPRTNGAAISPKPVQRGSGSKPAQSNTRGARPNDRRPERPERGARPGRVPPALPRDRRGKPTSRVSRSVPITEVVKEGDQVIVQISKEPIGTKGARVTSHVSLPGRYVVYLPTVDHVGVSKRIGSSSERARLREVVDAMKPPSGGLVIRTVAEGLTKKALKGDIGYLLKLWEDVSRKREHAKAPTILYTELDLVLKTARDLFTDEIQSIVIDDKEQYARLVRFVEMFMPNRVKDIHYYGGDEPIFDAYGIEDEIARALSRKVPLPSGGYLIIDQAEALTAIDVNTGRYVGKGSKDLEETALKTNLEAVDEIAYQLRFRNIGGLVILDLIDMDAHPNREKVWRALEQRLAKDKAKTTINRISELGLIEMTRKRTRESLSRTMHEMCFYCDGTGQIQSRTTIAYEILRQIRRERHSLPGYSVLVNAHPAVIDLLAGEEKAAVVEAERRYMRRIELNPHREYHIEQFDLQGK